MKNILILFALVCASFVQSCTDNNDETPYGRVTTTIDDSDYSGNKIVLVYFTDNFSAESINRLRLGTKVRVRVYQLVRESDEDVLKTLDPIDYSFDWSGSSPAPFVQTEPETEFTVTNDLRIHLKISDR